MSNELIYLDDTTRKNGLDYLINLEKSNFVCFKLFLDEYKIFIIIDEIFRRYVHYIYEPTKLFG